MNYCGIDLVLRETAGNFTLLEERDQRHGDPEAAEGVWTWVKALLGRLLGTAAAPLLEGHLRFVVGDGSTVQGPGAKGTEHRLHLAVDLVRLKLIFVKVTNAHEGESLRHYPLRDGDVVVVDRGYNSARALIECADRGVAVVVRYNPHSLNLYDAAGAKIDWLAELQATTETERCIPVRVQVEGEFIAGYLHGCRRPPAQAGQGPAAGASPGPQERAAGASSAPGLGRVGVGLEHPAPGRVADGDRAGTLPAPVASGAGHQAMEIHREYRSSPRPSGQRAGRSLSPRQAALCLGAGEVGPGDGAVTIGIAWTARAARPRGGYGSCCARNWRP